jgi:glutamate-1-semialdehyde 2,1-aminomutase
MLETQSRLRAISQAAGALAGGVSSPVRAGAAVGGRPFVQRSGRGAYAFDSQGRAYVDYVMAYGPLLFGHAHPALVTGLDALAAGGSVFGSTHAEEVRLAERIAEVLPSMQTLRFVSTGTEAMMSAFRTARAFTGRPAIVRFAGNYHGHFDAALHDAGASAHTPAAECSGIPARTAADAIVARYNDLADLDAKLAPRADEVAAIALEPIVANMGLVLPDPGFLAGVFERARRAGALVIFDEVITWLRLGLGGAQEMLGFRPDLTALGKVMGGGFPLAAFGGRSDVMSVLSPDGASFAGGTFSGNPFSVALGHRVLDAIESEPGLYEQLESQARRLGAGTRRLLDSFDLNFPVTQLASIVDLKFRRGPAPRNYDEASQADGELFAAYYHAMRTRGVLLAPSPNEVMFLSSEHGPAEIDRTLAATEASLRELRERGRL